MGIVSSHIIASLRMHSCTFITVCMYVCKIFFWPHCVVCGNLSSSTRDWTWALSSQWSPNQWTDRVLYSLHTVFNHVQYLFMWLLILFHILANVFIYLFFGNLHFYWSIFDLYYFVIFMYTAMWFSLHVIHIYVHTLLLFDDTYILKVFLQSTS